MSARITIRPGNSMSLTVARARGMLAAMQIRPVTASDLEGIAEIDGTVESSRYLHIDRTGEGLAAGWQLAERPARQKLIEANRMPDEAAFFLRQVATGM